MVYQYLMHVMQKLRCKNCDGELLVSVFEDVTQYECDACGAAFTDDDFMELDHKKPPVSQ